MLPTLPNRLRWVQNEGPRCLTTVFRSPHHPARMCDAGDQPDDDEQRQQSGQEASPPHGNEEPTPLSAKEVRRVSNKLFNAAEDGDLRKLEKLFEKKYREFKGLLLDLRDEKGRTALHLAARRASASISTLCGKCD